MINRTLILLFVGFNCLCCRHEGSHAFEERSFRQLHTFIGAAKGSVLYPYVKSDQLSGAVEIEKESNDTLINLKYDTSLLDVRVDTVYFYCMTDSVFKCLFKTPLEKGLMYLEQDRTGKYENYQYFGGWVKSVNVIEVLSTEEETKLAIKLFSLGSFGFNYDGVCVFRSSNSDISFRVQCEE